MKNIQDVSEILKNIYIYIYISNVHILSNLSKFLVRKFSNLNWKFSVKLDDILCREVVFSLKILNDNFCTYVRYLNEELRLKTPQVQVLSV